MGPGTSLEFMPPSPDLSMCRICARLCLYPRSRVLRSPLLRGGLRHCEPDNGGFHQGLRIRPGKGHPGRSTNSTDLPDDRGADKGRVRPLDQARGRTIGPRPLVPRQDRRDGAQRDADLASSVSRRGVDPLPDHRWNLIRGTTGQPPEQASQARHGGRLDLGERLRPRWRAVFSVLAPAPLRRRISTGPRRDLDEAGRPDRRRGAIPLR